MSLNKVAIAKASLIAPFVKSDPSPVPREEINELPGRIAAALRQCSRRNIQNCREWLCKNVTSSGRATAVGKYLTALSASLRDGEHSQTGDCSARRQRLHALYILNDWLHHLQSHSRTTAARLDIIGAIQAFVGELLRSATMFDPAKFPKLRRRLKDLLSIWEMQQYFSYAFCQKLFETLEAAGSRLAPETEKEETTATVQDDEAMPFVMPLQHGDPSAQWYDLPAANMLPHMIANDSTPINPQQMIPLQFRAGPADSSLIALVKDFIKEADTLYGKEDMLEDGTIVDYDALGQKIYRDAAGGGASLGETYYGWSREFSEKMQRKKKETLLVKLVERDQERGRASGRRSSYSSSIDSRSSDMSRNGRRQKRSYSRSPSRDRGSTGMRSRSRSRRQWRSRQRSKSPHQRSQSPPSHRFDHSNARGRRYFETEQLDREKSYSPSASNPFIPPPPPAMPSFHMQTVSSTPGTVFPSHLAQFLPPGVIGPGGNIPAPPPRPAGWQGLWPPPPPPPPPFSLPGGGRGAFPPFPSSFGQSMPANSPAPPFYQNNGAWQTPPDPRRRQ